jgi:hypothetical protein
MTPNRARIFVADFGQNHWTVFDSLTQEIFELSPDEFLTLTWLPVGSTLICEQAHLGSPRKDSSLAQVYLPETLLDFYDRADAKGCTIKLFPHQSTAKARARWGTIDKTDAVDVVAIYNHVVNSPYMPLMNPPKTFEISSSRQAGWAFKHETNCILNKARRFDYEDPEDQVVRFIDDNLKLITSKLSMEAREVFDVDRVKKDGNFYASSKRKMRLYTIASLFLQPDGTIRKRSDTDTIPGLRWLSRNVLHNGPFHLKGGIARSNLNHHGFKNYAIGKMDTRKASDSGKVLSHYHFTPEQDEQFRGHRRTFRRSVVEAMQVIRDIVKDDYATVASVV